MWVNNGIPPEVYIIVKLYTLKGNKKASLGCATRPMDIINAPTPTTNTSEPGSKISKLKNTKIGVLPIKIPPRCEACGGLLRPDVVWFGEPLDQEILHEIYRSLERAQTMLVVGTSGVVQPAASFGLVAKRSGAFVAELNRSRTPQSVFFDACLQGEAGKLLPQLAEHIAE